LIELLVFKYEEASKRGGGSSRDIIIEIEWVASAMWIIGERVETEEAARDVCIIDFST